MSLYAREYIFEYDKVDGSGREPIWQDLRVSCLNLERLELYRLTVRQTTRPFGLDNKCYIREATLFFKAWISHGALQ